MNRIPGVQGVLDQFEDMIGVPSLEMQLAWHQRNGTGAEAAPANARWGSPDYPYSDLADKVSYANHDLVSAANDTLRRHYLPVMQQQLENSRQLFEGIQRDQALQSLSAAAGMNPFTSQRDANRALGMAAYAPNSYLLPNGTHTWVDDDGNVLQRVSPFPDTLPR